MTSQTHRHRVVRLLLLGLLLLAALPIYRADAVLVATRTVASNNSDFVTGKFGLTGLVESGGVQLIPLGTLTRMRSNQPPLCKPLAEMGTASYETMIEIMPGVNRKSTYMYVVGGQTTGSVPNNIVNTTCYTHIKNEQGTTEAWTEDDSPLPVGLTNLESLAVTTAAGDAFLYAMGGQYRLDATTVTLSSNKIYRANINENTGGIGAWTEIGQLPDYADDGSELGTLGRHSFALTTYTDDNGKTYVYILGGARRYSSSDPPTSPFPTGYYRDVWRTTVKSDGTFGESTVGNVHGWTRLADIPIRSPSIADCAGLYDSQATIFDVMKPIGEDTVITPTLYLMGGRYDDENNACAQATITSADVYRATIGDNGSLTWDSSPDDAETEDRFTLLRSLYGHKAFGFSQKIYVLGGYDLQGSGGPTKKVFSAYADEDQDLVELPGGANFLESVDLFDPAMYAHGGQVGWWRGTPMIYVFGGRSSGTGSSTNDYLDRVLYAIPGTDDQGNEGFPTQGTYLSPPFDFEVTTQPISITWSAIISDTDTDIKISYRVADTPTALKGTTWRALDGAAGTRWTNIGTPITETVTIAGGPSGRFFQYRASLISANVTKTPILTNVKVSYNITGFPNLTVDDDPQFLPSFDPQDLGAGPKVRVVNEARAGGTTNFVIDADIQSDGTFYVDLFAFPPDTDPPPFDYNYARGLSDPDLLRSKAFVEINKARLPADGFEDISGWKRACSPDGVTPGADCPYMTEADWRVIFNQPGTWQLYLVIDSSNNVHEADTIGETWEAANIIPFSVEIPNNVTVKRIFMPYVFKKPPA